MGFSLPGNGTHPRKAYSKMIELIYDSRDELWSGHQRRSASRHGGNARKSSSEEPPTTERSGREPIAAVNVMAENQLTVNRGECKQPRRPRESYI